MHFALLALSSACDTHGWHSKKELTDMDKCIPETVLPEGYNGKILLVSIGGVGIEERIVLRSGDDWQREILRNTEAEIRGYGIDAVRVHELGGAWVKFDEVGGSLIDTDAGRWAAILKRADSMQDKDFDKIFMAAG